MDKKALFLLFFIINSCFSQIYEISNGNKLRSLKPKSEEKTKGKDDDTSKKQNKLLQTLYSDSSNNYFITLYIGEKKLKQTYLIDTGSAIMSSPCAPCKECGKLKKSYFESEKKNEKNQLKCGTKICQMVPSNGCINNLKKNKNPCSYSAQKLNGDGLEGYYLTNIVYFEEENRSTPPSLKQIYKSFALPIGCTSKEYGKYKELSIDGVMGLNNQKNSFTNLLYDLKIIDKNIFSLCFGAENGYMSFGEIDTTYHERKIIDFVPLINSKDSYLININGIQLGNNKKTKYNYIGNIDTGSSFTYLPVDLYKSIIKEFDSFCIDKKKNNNCGIFIENREFGYCTSFKDEKSLLYSINNYWPNIILSLDKNIEYIWKPINYYYNVKAGKSMACLGFLSHKSKDIILGANFIHGNDIIFDKENQQLGYVPADCSRRNLILNRKTKIELTPSSPVTKDKNISNISKDKIIEPANSTNEEDIEFIEGKNKELNVNDGFKLINYIILLVCFLVIIIIVLIIVIALMIKRRGLQKYQNITEENNKIANNQINNIIEESNDTQVTNEEVEFLKNMMKVTHK